MEGGGFGVNDRVGLCLSFLQFGGGNSLAKMFDKYHSIRSAGSGWWSCSFSLHHFFFNFHYNRFINTLLACVCDISSFWKKNFLYILLWLDVPRYLATLVVRSIGV